MYEVNIQVVRSDGDDSTPICGIMMAPEDFAVDSYLSIISETQGTSPVTSR